MTIFEPFSLHLEPFYQQLPTINYQLLSTTNHFLMRHFYSFCLLLAFTLPLSAQIREVPLESNPVLQRAFAQKQTALASQISKQTGLDITRIPQKKVGCPAENPGVFYVVAGKELSLAIDTVGKNGGGGKLTLLTTPALQFGTATLDSTFVKFAASGNILDVGFDTVRVEFCRADGNCEIFNYPIVVKRAGQQHLQNALRLNPNLSGIFEVDASLLPGELVCNELLDCPDKYDGEGRQIVYFQSYDRPENRLIYVPCRFPGTDTVCVVLCDEFTICDTFKMLVTIVGDTLGLPFFDDFYYYDEGPYPLAANWLDDDAFVNATMGKNPPSIGFATMEGLNAAGRPYGGGAGAADFLTSKQIDLSGESAASNVVLSFYAQPKGLGFQPRTQDSLIVELRDKDRNWVRAAGIPGPTFIRLDSVPPFQFYAVSVNDAAYFHDGFQFRFKNLNTREGAYGAWHVDYVLLNKDRDGTRGFRDMCFNQIPTNPLKNYTAIPYNHFVGNMDAELSPSLTAVIQNNFNDPQKPTSNNAFFKIESGTTKKLSDFPFLTGNINISALSDTTSTISIPSGNFGELKNNLNVPAAEKMIFSVNYELSLSDQIPAAFANDTIHRTVELDNYFAYDDGTAERAIEANGAGTRVALRFKANVADSIQGVRFHFPHINGDVSRQYFNLHIYLDTLKALPDFEMEFLRPIYTTAGYDSLQGFTTYVLQGFDANNKYGPLPVPVKAGQVFYVAWQQATDDTSPIPIGFDKNNPAAARYIWYNTGSRWQSLASLIPFQGAPMIRPVLGKTAPEQTAKNIDNQPDRKVTVYPNPARDVLFVEFEKETTSSFSVEIMSCTGQLIRRENLVSPLSVADLPSGVYYLKILENERQTAFTQKIIIAR